MRSPFAPPTSSRNPGAYTPTCVTTTGRGTAHTAGCGGGSVAAERRSSGPTRSPSVPSRRQKIAGELLQCEPDLQSNLIAFDLALLDRTAHLSDFEPTEI